jgi:RNAse (barnase) inhibitor barstar
MRVGDNDFVVEKTDVKELDAVWDLMVESFACMTASLNQS